jgi:hypothetical protein
MPSSHAGSIKRIKGPGAGIIEGIFGVEIGFIQIADVDFLISINGDRGIFPNIAGEVNRIDLPVASIESSEFQIPFFSIMLAYMRKA